MSALRYLIPDMVRRFLAPVPPPYIYQSYLSDGLTVGLVPVNLTARNIPCTWVMLQAGLLNAGVVYVGMQHVTAAIGIELDAGRAVAFSSAEFAALQHQQIAGSLGAGMMRYLDGQPEEVQTQFTEAVGRLGRYPKIVLNLHDIVVVASLAAQSLRFVYALPLGAL